MANGLANSKSVVNSNTVIDLESFSRRVTALDESDDGKTVLCEEDSQVKVRITDLVNGGTTAEKSNCKFDY
jgi:hypothetical protein